MADTVINVRDAKTGQIFPIKAVDTGGGIYNAGPIPLIFKDVYYRLSGEKPKKQNLLRRVKLWLTRLFTSGT